MLREVKFTTQNLKTLLIDTKAVTATLPHMEVKDYLPFNNDEDLVTVLTNTNLTNALYAKVSGN